MTEGEHIFGFLVEKARSGGIPVDLLEVARCHLAVYAAQNLQRGAGAKQ